MDATKVPDLLERRLGICHDIRKVIHVGANTGQELAGYEKAGIEGYHIEAMPAEFEQLKQASRNYGRQTAIQACCDAEAGRTVTFHVTNNSQSSSLLDLGRHAVAYPDIEVVDTVSLETTTLDHLLTQGILPPDPCVLVLDVQGAECRVLDGARALLQAPTLWGIISEVSLDAIYEGGATFDRLHTEYFQPNGFYLNTARFNKKGWTDALFLKRWWETEGEGLAPLQAAIGTRVS